MYGDIARRFVEIIEESSEVLIISHANPDGDAVGSVVSMKKFLAIKGRRSEIALPGAYPRYLSFLDDNGDIILYNENPDSVKDMLTRVDLIIALDFNRLGRIDGMQDAIASSTVRKVLIDHHPQPEESDFDFIISDVTMSSTCELLFWLFYEIESMLSEERVCFPLELAKSLYVGMMTDTNNFSNSVSDSTFRMASELLGMGIDKEELQYLVFSGFSEKRMRLMGYMLLNKMIILPELKAGYMILTLSEQEKYGYAEGDSEGFVNLPLSVKGVEVSALFTEREDVVKVSLRSSNEFSVNRMARRFFNGGGHERASGGRLSMKIDDVPAYFEEKLKESLNNGLDNSEDE